MWILAVFVLLPLSRGLEQLLEGDVAVPTSSTGDTVQDSFLLAPSKLWSNGIVPYLFEKLPLEGGGEEPIFSDHHKQMIREAMAHISEKVPCLQFTEVSSNFRGAHIIFSAMGDDNNAPSGCWAYVGCQGSQGGKSGQTVNLGSPGCFNLGTIVHEILHTLGATHEQNREDRDKYVRIVEDDISELSQQKNFEKKSSLFSSYGTPYDYNSIMHYDEYAFSVSGNKTIIPLQTNITLLPVSSKSGLSPIDTMELAHVYEKMTTEDCYKRDTIMAYLHTLEDKLNQAHESCPGGSSGQSQVGPGSTDCTPFKENIKFKDIINPKIWRKSTPFIPSAMSCHELCKSRQKCFRWTWSKLKERCLLMGEGSGMDEEQNKYFVSGLQDRQYCIV